jgi:RHS repeat-associated protein
MGRAHGRANYTPYGREEDREGYVDVYGFNGEELDPSTGLQRFSYRYYDRDSTRWVSPDPKFTVATTENMSLLGEATTGYMYVAGNPITFADPTGLEKKEASKKPMVRDLHHKKDTRNETNRDISGGTKNLKKLTGGVAGGGTATEVHSLMDSPQILNFHSTDGGKAALVSVASTEKGKSGQKYEAALGPKDFAKHLATGGWNGDTLILASCSLGSEAFDDGGTKSSFSSQLATELSQTLKKEITVIAAKVPMGVTKTGKFYTKDGTRNSKGKKISTTGIKDWTSATADKGGKSTLSDLTQKAASKFPQW